MTAVEFDPKMIELLVCPLTGCPLKLDRENNELISTEAGIAFPIRSGVPIMLTSEARPLEESERARHKSRRP